MKNRHVSLAVSLLFTLCFASLAAAQDSASRYIIQYTGRTLGYARIPDRQDFNVRPDAGAERNPVAKAYADLFTATPPAAPLLRLGMGDNFAPNLLARVFHMPTGQPDRKSWCQPNPDVLLPKDRFFFDNKASKVWRCASDPAGEDADGDTAIDYDNVAQFFIASGYNALVPGKHDFYFGPEWLRDAARLLATGNVHMLGANLTISTTKAPLPLNIYPAIPDRYANLRYSTDFGPVSIDLPEMVFPYKQQFAINNGRRVLFATGGGLVPASQLATLTRKDVIMDPLVAKAWICGEALNPQVRDPRHIGLPGDGSNNCMLLTPAEVACAANPIATHLQSSCAAIYNAPRAHGRFNPATDPAPPSPNEIYLFEQPGSALTPDRNYLFCTRLNGIGAAALVAKKPFTCQPFSVQMPFFTWGGVDHTPGKGEADIRKPFELVETGGLRVAVFGVVDPDLLTNVGLVNYGWLNGKRRLDTVAKVAPADATLQQALELCNSKDDCRKARKIVMAQMSWAKAGQLIARFGDQFDLAISQADDDHDPGEYHAAGSVAAKPGPRLLLTPPDPAKPGSFVPKVSTATVSFAAGVPAATRTFWTLDNVVTGDTPIPDPAPAQPCGGPCLSVSEASRHALDRAKAWTAPAPPLTLAPDPSDDVRDLALHAMRQYLKTDIALLQKRDLYAADTLSARLISQAELQDQLQRIFWKGDYVTRFQATGATLRKIMKQSKKFAALDRDALATEVEHNRDLLTLGLFSDPQDGDTLYVNGAVLDDAALYSVAATQFLGLGDTGYADLATPDVPPAYRVEDFNKLRPLAGVVCAAIQETRDYPGVQCDNAVLTNGYFDPSNARPLDETPGFNAASHYTTLGPRVVTDGSVPATGVKGDAQQRGFFAISLENFDLAWSGTYINHVSAVAGNLAGITAPGVTAKGSNTIGADHRVRALYDFRHGTFYALNETTFARTSTGVGVPTLASNMIGYEGGGTLRLLDSHRPAWLSLQYSSRFQRQLTDPSQIQGPSGLYLPVPRISALSGRLGLRIDHGDTYLEAGLEQVDSLHILTRYQFADAAATVCVPSTQFQLGCVNAAGKTVAISDASLTLPGVPPPQFSTADYLTGGAYLNFALKFPLWSQRDASRGDQTWYFTLTNHGDLYFNSHNDTATQTRYLDKLTPAFSIPIYGKLALTPKVDFILYENKVFRYHYRAVAPSLTLSYSFRWRHGMEFKRALGFGAITASPGTAGSLPQK